MLPQDSICCCPEAQPGPHCKQACTSSSAPAAGWRSPGRGATLQHTDASPDATAPGAPAVPAGQGCGGLHGWTGAARQGPGGGGARRALYSFMSAGSTVKGEQVSATIAMATVVHTRFWRSCTFRLFSSVTSTSCARARARVRRRRTAAAAARSCSCRPAAPPGPCMRRHRTPTPPRTHASGGAFALGNNSQVIGTQPRIQGAGRDGACDRQLRLSQFKTGWPSAARPPADAHLLRKQKRNEAAAADNLAARQSRARRGGEGGEARAPAGRWPWRCSQRC